MSVVCECMLNIVKCNVHVSIPNLNKFEETYKFLINPKTSLEKNQLLYWVNKDFI